MRRPSRTPLLHPHHCIPINESWVPILGKPKETVPKATAAERGGKTRGRGEGEESFRQEAGAARRDAAAAARPPAPRPDESTQSLRALGSGKAPHLLQGGAALTP